MNIFNQLPIQERIKSIGELFAEKEEKWEVSKDRKKLKCSIKTDYFPCISSNISEGPTGISVDFETDKALPEDEKWDTDLLGIYTYTKNSANIGEIILYAKPILCCAKALNCDANVLADVVLCHELGHFAVHVVLEKAFSKMEENYHEQWAQCLAYWVLADDLGRGVLEKLEGKQSCDYQLDSSIKDIIKGDDAVAKIALINLLKGGCPNADSATREKADTEEDTALIQIAEENSENQGGGLIL